MSVGVFNQKYKKFNFDIKKNDKPIMFFGGIG